MLCKWRIKEVDKSERMTLDDPTVNAAMAEENFISLSASTKGRLDVCTRRMNEIKPLLVHGGHVDKVKEGAALFLRSLVGFVGVHGSVQVLQDIKEKETKNWFETKMSTFKDFLKDLETRKESQMDPQLLIQTQDKCFQHIQALLKALKIGIIRIN